MHAVPQPAAEQQCACIGRWITLWPSSVIQHLQLSNECILVISMRGGSQPSQPCSPSECAGPEPGPGEGGGACRHPPAALPLMGRPSAVGAAANGCIVLTAPQSATQKWNESSRGFDHGRVRWVVAGASVAGGRPWRGRNQPPQHKERPVPCTRPAVHRYPSDAAIRIGLVRCWDDACAALNWGKEPTQGAHTHPLCHVESVQRT